MLRLKPTCRQVVCANASPHVTVSHSTATQAVYSNQLLSAPHLTLETASAGLELQGVVGVAVARAASHGLELLPPKIRKEVEEFVRDALPGAKVRGLGYHAHREYRVPRSAVAVSQLHSSYVTHTHTCHYSHLPLLALRS